jgi:hypothetical protein
MTHGMPVPGLIGTNYLTACANKLLRSVAATLLNPRLTRHSWLSRGASHCQIKPHRKSLREPGGTCTLGTDGILASRVMD